MSLENSVLTRSLVVFGVMLGAAFAAEPIFVTPPAKIESMGASTSQAPTDPLDVLPVAKSYPVAPAEGASQADTLSQPVFVTTPKVAAPAAVDRSASESTTQEKVDEVAPAETKPVVVGPPRRPAAPVAAPTNAPVTQETEKPAEKGATATDGGRDNAEQSPVASEHESNSVKFGLGLAPIKVEPGLPPELGILQTALEKVVDNTAFLPEGEAQKLLCNDAGKISDLARELSRTPLIEVTTHFTLWRSAMSDLLGSTDVLRQQCQQPSQQSVEAFKKLVKDFSNLLEVR